MSVQQCVRAVCTSCMCELFVRAVRNIYSSCVYDLLYELCVRSVRRSCVYELCVRTVCTSCVYELYVRAVCTNCVYEMYVRPVCTNCVYEMYVRAVFTNCVYEMCVRAISTSCVYELCDIRTVCTSRPTNHDLVLSVTLPVKAQS